MLTTIQPGSDPMFHGSKLRVLANVFASGRPLDAGRIYTVPDEVSLADSEELTRIGRAEPVKTA
ncbi:hypothetical protein ACKVEX_05470 [Rhodocyclaceae bacterium SMB388]